MFLTTFFRRLPKKFQHFPPKCHLSDDLLFSHRPFLCFNVLFFPWGAKSVTDIDTGVGQNPYISTNSQCYHCSFCPKGGQTPLPTSMGGHGRIPPWIHHWSQPFQLF